MMDKRYFRLLVIPIVFLFLFSFAGCNKISSRGNNKLQNIQYSVPQGQNVPSPRNQAIQPNPNTNYSMKGVIQDNELTQRIRKEKLLTGGQVYSQGDLVTATMTVKNGIKLSDAKRLAQSYLDSIKSRYPNNKVRVQAIQNGKIIVNLSYGM